METKGRNKPVVSIVWRLAWIVIAVVALILSIVYMYGPWLFTKTQDFDFAMCIAIPGILFFIINIPTMVKLIKSMGLKSSVQSSKGMQKIFTIIFMAILLLAVCAFVGFFVTIYSIIVKIIEIVKIVKTLRAEAEREEKEEI